MDIALPLWGGRFKVPKDMPKMSPSLIQYSICEPDAHTVLDKWENQTQPRNETYKHGKDFFVDIGTFDKRSDPWSHVVLTSTNLNDTVLTQAKIRFGPSPVKGQDAWVRGRKRKKQSPEMAKFTKMYRKSYVELSNPHVGMCYWEWFGPEAYWTCVLTVTGQEVILDQLKRLAQYNALVLEPDIRTFGSYKKRNYERKLKKKWDVHLEETDIVWNNSTSDHHILTLAVVTDWRETDKARMSMDEFIEEHNITLCSDDSYSMLDFRNGWPPPAGFVVTPGWTVNNVTVPHLLTSPPSSNWTFKVPTTTIDLQIPCL